MLRGVCGILLGLALCPVPGVARDGEPAGNLLIERFGPEHGLAHNTVHDLLEDRHGFIWIATGDGVNRYDGYEFRQYRVQGAAGSNVAGRLVEDDSGVLWVGTGGGLYRLPPSSGAFEAVDLPLERAPATAGISSLARDGRGVLWLAVGGEVLAKEPESDRFRRVFATAEGERGLTAWRLEGLPEGGVRVFLGDVSEHVRSLLRLEITGEEERLPFAADETILRELGFESLGRLRSPSLREALRRLVPDHQLRDVVGEEDPWLGTSAGLFRWRSAESRLEAIALEPTGSNWQQRYVVCLLRDRAGALWVGTLGGLFRIDPLPKRFVHAQHDPVDPTSLSADPVSAIDESHDGNLWIGTFGGGLNRFDRVTHRAERFVHDLPAADDADSVWAVLETADGAVWVGGVAGLSRLDRATGRLSLVEIRAGPEAAPGRIVRTLHEDPPGVLWIGVWPEGLLRMEMATAIGEWLYRGEARIVTTLWVSPSEAWIGRDDGMLVRLDPSTGSFQEIPLVDEEGARLLPSVMGLSRGRDGTLWVASSSGLGRFDPRSGAFELPIADDEMSGSVIFSIQADSRERLWLGTNQGLARFDPKAPEGSRVRIFDLEDGVGSIEFNRNAALRDRQGTMYFGGMTGLTIFQPERIVDNPYVPPVVVTRVLVLREEETELAVASGKSLELGPADAAVSFEFAALDYSQPAKNRYAYMMEGLDPGWIDAGTRRFARYVRMPPGNYVFRVLGSNNDGVWNDEGVALPITVLPPFWQTWWFRLSMLALAAALLYLAYRLRLARLLEMERMRLRIASDLHDELGSELSGIALASSMVSRRDYLEEGDRDRLGDIQTTATRVMQGLRDIIWYISPEHDTLASLAERMRSVAEVLLGDTEHELRTAGLASDPEIDMDRRRHLFLMYKELLNNAARHSQADRVAIGLSRQGDRMVLRMEDDGVGFDPAADTDGTGLRSLRRRAQAMGAELEIDSSPGAGTRVELRMEMTRTRRGRRA